MSAATERAVGVFNGQGCWGPPDLFLPQHMSSTRGYLLALGLAWSALTVAVVPEVWACLGQPLSREWSVCAHRVTEAYDLVPVK